MEIIKISSIIILFLTLRIILTNANNNNNNDEIQQQNPTGFSSKSFNTENYDYDGQAQTPIGYRARLNGYNYDDQTDDQPISQLQQQQQHQTPRSIYQVKKQQQPTHHAQLSSYIQKKEKNHRKYNNDQQQQQQHHHHQQQNIEQEEEPEEEEEVDRLTLLLERTSFKCNDRISGYYADESLGCEVFHYCQENQQHSWICPEGFTFHQVHLICMPPSGDNICQESSKYHIVNEYLYKPINTAEHQSRPNVTLRYSERYYPDAFYHDDRQNDDNDDDDDERIVHPHRHPVQVGFNSQQQQERQQQQHHQQQQQHHQQQQQQPQQPHQQNRPYYSRKPSIATTTSLPSVSYRFVTPSPAPQSLQTVYRSPEEINISLQQRRPHVFLTTSTPRFIDVDEEEGYQYDK